MWEQLGIFDEDDVGDEVRDFDWFRIVNGMMWFLNEDAGFVDVVVPPVRRVGSVGPFETTRPTRALPP